jgi:HAD superfamily hydrolase (TIGR01484 family)
VSRHAVLASDYDGTLATDGRVPESTLEALERARESGRKLLLVTGRELGDVLRVFPRVDLFDLVVAENGALLYRPATREERLLGERPPNAFVEALRTRGVEPLSVGRVIVATSGRNETAVLETIREMSLNLQLTFNRGGAMILPGGVDKATGVQAALDELGLSPHDTVGVGDAENDQSFLRLCGCAVAVANALPFLKEQADWVTAATCSAGVEELVEHLLKDDLRFLGPKRRRHDVPGGTPRDGTPFPMDVHRRRSR